MVHKGAADDEDHGGGDDDDDDGQRSWAFEPPKELTSLEADGSTLVLFGEGGSISYPAGYSGVFDLGRVELWANSGGGGGGGDDGDAGEEGEDGGFPAEASESAAPEVPVAELVKAGDASGFFAQLLAQEQVGEFILVCYVCVSFLCPSLLGWRGECVRSQYGACLCVTYASGKIDIWFVS
jgi:hypothetical protein